jgi:hypothetical protein
MGCFEPGDARHGEQRGQDGGKNFTPFAEMISIISLVP